MPFSSLVTIDDTFMPQTTGVTVTFVVLGDDACDYLTTGCAHDPVPSPAPAPDPVRIAFSA
jgi:hypothetical protein